jgi:hypothetical protein
MLLDSRKRPAAAKPLGGQTLPEKAATDQVRRFRSHDVEYDGDG